MFCAGTLGAFFWFQAPVYPTTVLFLCAGMFGALRPGFRSLATLKLGVNVVGERTERNSCGLRHRTASLRQHGFLAHNCCLRFQLYSRAQQHAKNAQAHPCVQSRQAHSGIAVAMDRYNRCCRPRLVYRPTCLAVRTA